MTKGRESIQAEKPQVCLVISLPPGNRNSEQTAVPVGRPFPSVSVLTPHLGEAEGEWRHHLPAVMASPPPADLEPSLP